MMIVVLLLGVWLGFLLGRTWSERSRAAAEARGAWAIRKRHRGTRPF